LLVALALVSGASLLVRQVTSREPHPQCTVQAATGSAVPAYTVTVEQAQNAATIAGVALRMRLPDHAVTIGLAAALQESGLVNLSYGDRDSVGLFQQRPSQGWGSPTQLRNPVYAATAFYRRLVADPQWLQRSVTDAAQQVQRSAAPLAYARWEDEARAAAAALTGEHPRALSCQDLPATGAGSTVAAVAAAELGTSTVSGPQPVGRGWALSAWLVGQAARVGVRSVSFSGWTWTRSSGRWSRGGPVAATLAWAN
jgi:hypothetical protein